MVLYDAVGAIMDTSSVAFQTDSTCICLGACGCDCRPALPNGTAIDIEECIGVEPGDPDDVGGCVVSACTHVVVLFVFVSLALTLFLSLSLSHTHTHTHIHTHLVQIWWGTVRVAQGHVWIDGPVSPSGHRVLHQSHHPHRVVLHRRQVRLSDKTLL